MHFDSATRWSLGLWLAFALLPVLVLGLPWNAWYQDQQAPAWVQAFGSILAIVGSGVIFALQRSSEHLDRKRVAAEAELQHIEGARRLLQGAINICLKLRRALDDQDSNSLRRTRIAVMTELSGVADALSAIEAFKLSRWWHTEAVVTARNAMRYLGAVIVDAGDALLTEKQTRDWVAECIDEVGTIIGDRHAVLERDVYLGGGRPDRF